MTDLPRWSFGDSPELADALLALVREGRKTATCWAAAQMGPSCATAAFRTIGA